MVTTGPFWAARARTFLFSFLTSAGKLCKIFFYRCAHAVFQGFINHMIHYYGVDKKGVCVYLYEEKFKSSFDVAGHAGKEGQGRRAAGLRQGL